MSLGELVPLVNSTLPGTRRQGHVTYWVKRWMGSMGGAAIIDAIVVRGFKHSMVP